MHKVSNNSRLAYIEGWVSIAINVLLFAFKYWAGIVSGSVALMADAWHTLSDSISSVVVLFSARVASKPPDKQHPFGHGRANLIASLIIGVFLGVIALEFLIESIDRLREKTAANYGILAIAVTAASVILKEGLARFSIWAGKKSNNQALLADGWHHRSDALSSIVVLAGIFLGKRFWWIDGLLGILVTGLLFYAAYAVIKEASNKILGEKPDEDTIERLRTLASQTVGTETYMHHIHIHRYGDHVEITLHIKLPPDTNLSSAHDIATQIEKRIGEEMDMEATIHMEPLDEPSNPGQAPHPLKH